MTDRESNKETQFVTNRYNHFAPFYNIMEGPLEYFWYRKWRKELWRSISGHKILEMGVGTGKNIIFYSGDKDITAIDISENMLKRARAQVEKLDYNCSDFIEMDIQNITFPDNLFDAVVATFVFCSVPNPVLGLKEALRVTRPDVKLT
ncbi:MAG TPA: class I SAM-dependent methyltransferase [Balneolales bacterium]|nr:class I SAM-dependent methyltransferase [Balneolales bacterium]